MQKKGDEDKAIADYSEALRLDPKFASAHNNRGLAYGRKGNIEASVADFEQAIRLDPKSSQIYNNCGFARKSRGEYEKAVADYENAIQLNSGSVAAHKNLAWLLATCPQACFRDGKRAVQLATRACGLSAWTDPFALHALAAASAEAGHFEDAIKWERQYLGTPDKIARARLNSESRLSLYEAHKTPVYFTVPSAT